MNAPKWIVDAAEMWAKTQPCTVIGEHDGWVHINDKHDFDANHKCLSCGLDLAPLIESFALHAPSPDHDVNCPEYGCHDCNHVWWITDHDKVVEEIRELALQIFWGLCEYDDENPYPQYDELNRIDKPDVDGIIKLIENFLAVHYGRYAAALNAVERVKEILANIEHRITEVKARKIIDDEDYENSCGSEDYGACLVNDNQLALLEEYAAVLKQAINPEVDNGK